MYVHQHDNTQRSGVEEWRGVGIILGGKSGNTDGGSIGRSFPLTMTVAGPDGKCLSHITVFWQSSLLVLLVITIFCH